MAGSSGSSVGWDASRRAVPALYGRSPGVKESWFGHVANIRAALAQKHGAVVVREDLSILAAEKKIRATRVGSRGVRAQRRRSRQGSTGV